MTAPARATTARLPRAQRRAQLFAVATTVFATKGYHAASMDDIAEAAQVTKPVVYQHFESKLDLYLTVLGQAMESMRITLTDALAEYEEYEERVFETVRAFIRFAKEREEEFRLIYVSATDDAEGHALVHSIERKYAATLAGLISSHSTATDEEASHAAFAIIGICVYSAVNAVEKPGGFDVDEVADRTSAMILSGLRFGKA